MTTCVAIRRDNISYLGLPFGSVEGAGFHILLGRATAALAVLPLHDQLLQAGEAVHGHTVEIVTVVSGGDFILRVGVAVDQLVQTVKGNRELADDGFTAAQAFDGVVCVSDGHGVGEKEACITLLARVLVSDLQVRHISRPLSKNII